MNLRDKHIEVIIGLDGDCTVEGHNFVGPECERFLDEITTQIGERTERTEKQEFRQRGVARQMERGR